MKREDLTAKGLTAEQVDFVMAEYGKELNPMKAERDSYKAQLDTAQASLKAMEGIDAAGLQTKVTELTNQLKGKDMGDREDSLRLLLLIQQSEMRFERLRTQ